MNNNQLFDIIRVSKILAEAITFLGEAANRILGNEDPELSLQDAKYSAMAAVRVIKAMLKEE